MSFYFTCIKAGFRACFFYFLVAPLMSMRPNNLSVILKRLFCNTCTFTMLSPLFGGRQQRVRRPSDNGCDDRQTIGLTAARR